MKRIALLAASLLLLLSSVSAFADDGVTYPSGTWRPSNEVSLSYGRVTFPAFVYTLGGILGTAFSFGLASPDKMVSTGSFGFEYMRYVHPNVGVGFLTDYEMFTLSFKTANGKDEDGNMQYKSSEAPTGHTHIICFMPAAKFPWFAYDHVTMYSKLALGVWVNSQRSYERNEETGEYVPKDNTQASFAFQASPVGVDFGGELCRGFVELGLGMQGGILGGVRFTF